jgi:hypothetical protein
MPTDTGRFCVLHSTRTPIAAYAALFLRKKPALICVEGVEVFKKAYIVIVRRIVTVTSPLVHAGSRPFLSPCSHRSCYRNTFTSCLDAVSYSTQQGLFKAVVSNLLRKL